MEGRAHVAPVDVGTWSSESSPGFVVAGLDAQLAAAFAPEAFTVGYALSALVQMPFLEPPHQVDSGRWCQGCLKDSQVPHRLRSEEGETRREEVHTWESFPIHVFSCHTATQILLKKEKPPPIPIDFLRRLQDDNKFLDLSVPRFHRYSFEHGHQRLARRHDARRWVARDDGALPGPDVVEQS